MSKNSGKVPVDPPAVEPYGVTPAPQRLAPLVTYFSELRFASRWLIASSDR